jgi:eukaryotic-like serine/threonine-protein kinase
MTAFAARLRLLLLPMLDNLPQRWATLSPLLDELLDLDAAGRSARLEQQRAADPRLADELAALLAEQAALEDEAFLEGAAPGMPLPAATLAGQRFGAYTLVESIGAGGMGSVWRARRSDGRFEGDVAVKLLNLALAAKGGAERFAREAQVLARLSHPNIAHLIDAGVSDGGQPFIVLEHVQGEPIDRHCDTRALTIEARVRLLLQVMAAVEHAHGRLVLHRDLKPGNILVTTEGQIKLLDFGIAKLLDDSGGGAAPTELTQLAGRAFTPEFAAPEQVQGGEVTTATDVYALGVLMYVLLSGAHPTARPTATPVDRLRSVVETEPQRLSAAAPARTMQGLRGDLDNIAAKALKKAPSERYASVAGFAADLQRWLADEPVSARADTWRYRAAKFVRRHRIGVAAASLVALSLIAGIVGTSWQAFEARRERDRALFESGRALAKGNLFNLLLGELGDTDRPLTQHDILDRAVQLVRRQFGGDPRLAFDLLLPIAGQYMSLGDTRKEAEVMQLAAGLARQSGDPALVADAACNTVDTEFRLGRPEAAREQLRIALVARAQVPEPDWGIVTACLRAEADVAQHDGDLDRAVDRIRSAIELMEREGRTQGNVYPSLLSYLTVLQQRRGDWPAVHALVTQRRQRMEALGQTGSADYVGTVRELAAVHMVWGEVQSAAALIEPMAARWAQGRDGGDGGTAPPWFDTTRAQVLLRLGAAAQAQPLLQQALRRAQAEGNQPSVKAAALTLVQALQALGRFDDAERLLPGLEADAALAANPRITPATLRAQALLASGATAQAIATIEAEIARRSEPPRVPAHAAALRVAAAAHLAAGHAEQAAAAASAAAESSRRVARTPEASADVGEALLLLAKAQRAAGSDGRDSATRAAPILALSLGADHALAREAQALSSTP